MNSIIFRIQELWNRFKRNFEDSRISQCPLQEFISFASNVTSEKVRKVTCVNINSQQCSEVNSKLELPVTLGRFTYLKHLSVRNCGLNTLPWSCVYLKQLESLDISNNCFQYLPSFIDCLISLKVLDVQNNWLVVLPTAIFRLSNLKVLKIEGNMSMESPPYSICRQGLKAILASLAERENRKNLWEGSRFVGTSLSAQFGINEIPSLFCLAAQVVTSFKVDFYFAPFVPPRLKTYLEEERKNEIKVAKCSTCRGYFSNDVMFEAHVCRTRLNQRRQ